MDPERPYDGGQTHRRYIDEAWLRREYVQKGRTQRDIADECGVHQKTISNWLDEHGIETGYGASVTHSFNNDGYVVLVDYVNREAVKHSRLLATLLVDDIEELRGHHVHHDKSPMTVSEATGVHVDLDYLGNISVVDPSTHAEIHHATAGD